MVSLTLTILLSISILRYTIRKPVETGDMGVLVFILWCDMGWRIAPLFKHLYNNTFTFIDISSKQYTSKQLQRGPAGTNRGQQTYAEN